MRKPLIGLTPASNKEETYLMMNNGYMKAIEQAGGLPVVLPMTNDPAILDAYINQLDGFVLTGGADIDPLLYGQQTQNCCGAIDPVRDAMEVPFAQMLAKQDKPVLGVCRGCQVLNVALGGTMYQDLPTNRPESTLAHRQKQPDRFPAHSVDLVDGTLLANILDVSQLMVNSLHHQGIDQIAPSLTACATAPDGLVEAVYLPTHSFFLGVQWHPERMFESDPLSMTLFQTFVQTCFPASLQV